MNLDSLLLRILQQQNEDTERMVQQKIYYPSPITHTWFYVGGRKHMTHVHKGDSIA